ncbi:hypothetical protein AAVH_06404 [Aphelenchoides avenae]|nr:hypothetical protein AAVH_06404 [Aphelenchus avenae]
MKKIMSTFPFFGNFSAEKIRYLVFTTPPPTTPVPEMRHLYAWGHLNLRKARSVEPKDVCNYADNTLCNQHNPTLECTCLKVPGKASAIHLA